MANSNRSSYREQLYDRLVGCGWELVEIQRSQEWWADEHWLMSSTRNAFGLKVVISFLVDLSYDGNAKSARIYAVSASTDKPHHYSDTTSEVARLSMYKGLFDKKIRRFVDEVCSFRSSVEQKAK